MFGVGVGGSDSVGADHVASGAEAPGLLSLPLARGDGLAWHYLSNAACLTRHHLFSTALLV